MAEKEKVTLPDSVAETEIKTYSTNDYGLFKYIDANRTVNKRHVQEIIQSMEQKPDYLKHRPVLVNDALEIIDGQHRVQAASTLHVPIYFQIAEDTGISDAQLMNALQRGWSLIDFARSHALNNSDLDRAKVYKTFLSLFEEYKIPISQLVAFCEQRNRRNSSVSFKKGELTIKDEATTRNWLNMMEEILETIDSKLVTHSRYALTSALMTMFKHGDYDHERMIKKLKEVKLEQHIDRAAYLRAMEAIYNNKLQDEAKRVRFF